MPNTHGGGEDRRSLGGHGGLSCHLLAVGPTRLAALAQVARIAELPASPDFRMLEGYLPPVGQTQGCLHGSLLCAMRLPADGEEGRFLAPWPQRPHPRSASRRRSSASSISAS